MDLEFNLKQWRKDMGGISQQKAAIVLGYSKSYIQQIELGKVPPPRLMPDACENKLRKMKESS